MAYVFFVGGRLGIVGGQRNGWRATVGARSARVWILKMGRKQSKRSNLWYWSRSGTRSPS